MSGQSSTPSPIQKRTTRLISTQWFAIGLVAVTVLAAFLRFAHIGARPIHYDEAVHGLQTIDFVQTGFYRYQGKFHGPVLYYLSALLDVAGVLSIRAGRILVASISLLMFPSLYVLRRHFDERSLLVAGFILAINPVVLWTSRFYRNDALLATALLVLISTYALYREQPTLGRGALVGSVAAFAFGTKEVILLLFPLTIGSLALLAHFDYRYSSRDRDEIESRYAPRGGRLAMVGVFLALSAFLYGGWPPNPFEAPIALLGGLKLWFTRGSSGDIEPLRYVKIFIEGSLVLLALGGLGCLSTYLRPRTTSVRWVFIAWLGGGSVLLSLQSHQGMWLAIFIATPLALIAGAFVTDFTDFVTGTLSATSRQTTFATVSVVLLLMTAGAGAATMNPYSASHPEISGFSTPAESVEGKEAFLYAANQSQKTDCTVAVGPWVQRYPRAWFLRSAMGYDFISTYKPNVWPAVIVYEKELPEVANRTTNRKIEGWHVYTPMQNCTASE